MNRTPTVRRRLAGNDAYTFLMKELEKVDETILEPLSATEWPRDMPVVTGGGLIESVASIDVTYASTGGEDDNLFFDAANDIPVIQADMSKSVARTFNFAEYMAFLNMEKLIQCKNGPEPLKSKGLRDSSLFSAVVLIVEKGWGLWRSRQIGAYQHTKPNGHTILEMNRVTVQWERVIVYRESCDSRLLQSKRPFFGPIWPDVPPAPCRSGLCSTRTDEGQQRRTCWKTKVSGATLSGTGDVRVIVTVIFSHYQGKSRASYSPFRNSTTSSKSQRKSKFSL